MQDGFVIQPSDTLQVRSMSNNTERYTSVFLHNPNETGGAVKVTTLGGKDLTIYVAAGETSDEEVIKVWANPGPPAGLLGMVRLARTLATLELTAIAASDPISKPKNTQFNSLGLPATVATITLSDTTQLSVVPVTWEYGNFNPDTAGVYVLRGRVALPPKVLNPRNISTSISVTLT